MILEKYTIGMGDRFGRQGRAQLDALLWAHWDAVDVTPVWNKSHREHQIVGTRPADVRAEADAAVAALAWGGAHYVDADHINLGNVEAFLECSDFFTLDVADYIGRPPADAALDAFVARNEKRLGRLEIPGVEQALNLNEEELRDVGRRFLCAVQEAGCIYRHIERAKGAAAFVTEVSMDEAAAPQTPAELLFILEALAAEGVPAQTIAPKFTGRFNKGVDYVGDVAQFEKEFTEDLAVLQFAAREFGLPANLKLSVHSGSDKFAIYAPIRRALARFDAGVHLKTAGTTWLEELIGLAAADGSGLALAKDVYAQALGRFDELCAPYAPVIDIDAARLPAAETVAQWNAETFASTLRHDQTCKLYNPHFRQLLHVGYKVAAEMGARYLDALAEHETIIAQSVTENLYARHLRPLFGDK